MATIGEVTAARKIASSMGGNTKNFPHTKKFCSKYGGDDGCGLLILVLFQGILTAGIDFIFKPISTYKKR